MLEREVEIYITFEWPAVSHGVSDLRDWICDETEAASAQTGMTFLIRLIGSMDIVNASLCVCVLFYIVYFAQSAAKAETQYTKHKK